MKQSTKIITVVLIILAYAIICWLLSSCNIQQPRESDPNLTPTAADDANSLAAKGRMYLDKLKAVARQSQWEHLTKGLTKLLPFYISIFGAGFLIRYLYKDLGMQIMAAAGSTALLILVISILPFWAAIIGLVLLIVIAAIILSTVIPEMIRRWRALTEIVKGGEEAKTRFDNWHEEKFREMQKSAQSPETESIVKKIKEKINGKEKNNKNG